MNRQGLLLCAKYAVSPNFFGYCGPSKSSGLIDHLKESLADKEVCNILSDFETLYPYLQLIARQNKINDPFDQRVVEAYWIGNSLLKPVDAFEFRAFSKEKLILDKKLPKKNFQELLTNISKKPFLPHHAFHVFNVFKRSVANLGSYVLLAMDECRIGHGIVKRQKSHPRRAVARAALARRRQGFGGQAVKSFLVETRPLIKKNNGLDFGLSMLREIKVDYKGKSFVKDLKVGDLVSFHWGFVCDVLTEKQIKNLRHYTQKAIDFYNQ